MTVLVLPLFGSFLCRYPAQRVGQFLINNKNMAIDDCLDQGRLATMHIFKPLAMVKPGDHPQPVPFGGVGKPVNLSGRLDQLGIATRRACVITSLTPLPMSRMLTTSQVCGSSAARPTKWLA